MKTLIVDDNIVNRSSIQKIIEDMGVNESAVNGQDAIEMFKLHLVHSRPFDLVLLDIVMPGMDGIKVLKALRDIENEHNVEPDKRSRILMVTSHSHKDVVLAALKSGCDGYIVKPFRRDVLIKKLKELNMAIPVTR
ncbi:MAG: response regulator [Proteobacteria bacterium]|nr:response regulator [Pseudomonadota bacterium]